MKEKVEKAVLIERVQLSDAERKSEYVGDKVNALQEDCREQRHKIEEIKRKTEKLLSAYGIKETAPDEEIELITEEEKKAIYEFAHRDDDEINSTIIYQNEEQYYADIDNYLNQHGFSEECDAILEMFTPEELIAKLEHIDKIKADFNAIHRLDLIDWTIPFVAGLLGGIIDIVLVGIPHPTADGEKAGPLSNCIRNLFKKMLPPEEMEKLANHKNTKTPFDAQDNRATEIHVEGLSAQYHRLLELGHDPILAFIVGVLDILNGTMTTIDKKGNIVVQTIKNYADRKESSLFEAIAKAFRHLISDVNTPMGLPVPLMGLFNLFQFGSIGEYEQTIAEIVQGMYYDGYDFIHFCSMSVPTMIIEVFVRVAYGIKRRKEGYSLKESIPFTSNRQRHPKLGTELFLAHTVATAINAGKVYIAENPLAINYPQWIAFGRYGISQLIWVLIKKPAMRDAYINGRLDKELAEEWLNLLN